MISIDKTNGKMLGVINTSIIEDDFMGKKVKAVFKPIGEREGTLKDILHWDIKK